MWDHLVLVTLFGASVCSVVTRQQSFSISSSPPNHQQSSPVNHYAPTHFYYKLNYHQTDQHETTEPIFGKILVRF